MSWLLGVDAAAESNTGGRKRRPSLHWLGRPEDVGGRLGLAEKTIKHYMTAILGKLEVGNRVEAALLAYKSGVRSAERQSRRDG